MALALAGLVIFGSGKIFRRTEQFVAIFSGSVNGLSVGAPVKFRGVQVGSVTSILLSLPGMTLPDLRIPVFFDIDRDTILKLGAMVNPADPSALAALIDQGLRDQLELGSPVSGVLFVQLALCEQSLALLRLPHNSDALGIPRMPTLPMGASVTAEVILVLRVDVDILGVD